MYLHDPSHSSFNAAESQIARSNLYRLGQSWTLSLGSALASGATVAGGVLYFGDWDGNLNAVRASDGTLLWRQWLGRAAEPEIPGCQPAIGVTSQPVVNGNTVYAGGGDSALYALDRDSGNILWRVALADPASGAYLWSSITAAGQSLYIGIASLGDCPLVRGALVRIDLDNPVNPVVRYLVPEDGLGAGIWSTPAVDEASGTVYVTTGTGEQDADAGVWGGTLMALDAKTLETLAYFFLPTNSLENDIEWGSSPTLLDLPDGARLVAATGKDGVLYVLNRDDFTLRWTLKLAIECICPECGCGSLSTPAFDGTYLYVGAGSPVSGATFANGSVYAIDPASGRMVWLQSLIGTVLAPVTIANGIVFASTTYGAVALDSGSGTYLWDDSAYGTLYSQAVIADGSLYTTYL